MTRGRVGESYNVGANAERTNIAVVHEICALLDELVPQSPFRPHQHLITFVPDRPGHDQRYALDASKLRRELCWEPKISFEGGLRKTVEWYLANRAWADAIRNRYGGERLGTVGAR